MGIWDTLLGGMGASTNPSDYKTPYQDQNQIHGLINNGLAGLQNRAAPQLNAGPQDQLRAGQMSQIGQLQGIASGQQQGAGELATQRAMQNALAGQQAMARMRGAGGGGMLEAARNAGAIGLNAAGAGQQAALQDQMGAQQLLSGALNGARGQDLQLAGQNAQLSQNGQQMNDQQYIALLSQLTGMNANQLQAQIQAMSAKTQQQGLLGPLLSTGGGVLGAYLGAKG